MNYSATELMICCASRALQDGWMVAVGTGVPCAAAMLAQKTHAPNLVICFEAGGVAPLLPTMPVSVGDSRTIHKAIMAASMAEVMQFCQKGLTDATFLSGAQIDAYGNLNSTVIGPHQKPKVRLPGSGGANDLASFCKRTLVIMKHDAKKFVEKLDFLTTPGYLKGGDSREQAGLPPGSGPFQVISDLAILSFHPTTKRMRIKSLHPGITREQVETATGFTLEEPESLNVTPAPTEHDLKILREQVDPLGYILGRER